MDEISSYQCPNCGEPVDIPLDPTAGEAQTYVEDCPVCCRPNIIEVTFDRTGNATVNVTPE
jgi:endogenous inhibitor of DNA gyrase (YacG/DUF329 family)